MGIDAQMFVRVRPALDAAQIRRVAFEMCECFGAEKFMLDRTGRYGDPHHAIRPVAVYEQDGDDITPKPGEQFLNIELYGRYYGPHYERGDAPFLICLADWLERRTGGVVWYGGDSSGVLAKLFDAPARDRLMAHFVRHGHRPYRSSFSDADASRRCDFCCEPMYQYGFGSNGKYAAFRCDGCDLDEVTRDGGVTWKPKAEDEAAQKTEAAS